MRNSKTSGTANCRIAVIGISCNYPGATSPLQLWENILATRRQFREMPDVRLPNEIYYDPDPAVPNKTYLNKAAVIDGFEFDWLNNKIPRQTYECTDVVHWLALDTALHAIEDTQYTRESLPKENAGVILGNTLTGEFTRSNNMLLRWPYVRKALRASAKKKGLDFLAMQLEGTMEEFYKSVFAPVTEDTLAGGLANTIAGRVCNFFDLHGGGYIVDGACSSSLIAVVTAANMLELGQLDLAIAGGVDISLDTFELIGFAKTSALTPDEMRVYDKNGKGFIPGEGCGMIVLKRYEDAVRDKDYIYATIEGWGISSDGKGGITAPSVAGQSRALKRAYQKAGLSPVYIDFIEGHGTGTTVGDKVELEAISRAFGELDKVSDKNCGVTSFKSIVGHTKAAAGIGAFIKAVMAVNRRILPPTAGLKELNPIFYDKAKCLYPIIEGEIRKPDCILKAGISAMGFGGINSHVIIRSGEAPSEKLKPELDEQKLLASSRSHELFIFSGNTAEELAGNVNECLILSKGISYAEMSDLSFFVDKRADLTKSFRAAVVAANPFDLAGKLRKAITMINETGCSQYHTAENDTIAVGCKKEGFKIGALFPGQGSQKLNMAVKVGTRYEPLRAILDEAECILKAQKAEKVLSAWQKKIYKAISPEQVKEWQDQLKSTDIAQPAITIASLMWYEYLCKLGLEFSCCAGHSLGELMAFYSAGLMDLATVLTFSIFRGRSMAEMGSGGMVSLQCSVEEAQSYISAIDGYAAIANINGPEQIVVSGEKSAIDKIAQIARDHQKNAIILPVSAAFHSNLISETSTAIKSFEPLKNHGQKNDLVLISCMDGSVVPESVDLNGYFSAQAINQVNFVKTVQTLSEHCDAIVEVGPGRVLTGLVSAINNKLKVFPVEINGDDDLSLNILIGNLYVNGCTVNINELFRDRFVRDFVPAAKRKFIVNPLEREFPAETGANSLQAGIPVYSEKDVPNDFANYLAARSGFIKEIIDADYRHFKAIPKADPVYEASPEDVSKTPAALDNKPNTVREVLYDTLQSMTGFSPDSFKDSMKLLDDFNLDSIKSGLFLNKISKQLGISGKLNIAELSNASLAQIILKIENLTGQVNAPVGQNNKSGSVRETVYSLLSSKTGFPVAELKPDFRLLDDLNLDSIKSGAILAELGRKFNIPGKLSSALSNAKISEIVDAISGLLGDEVSQKEADESANATDWANAYSLIPVSEPLIPDDSVHSLDDKKVVILYNDGDKEFADNLCAELKSVVADSVVTDIGGYENLALSDDSVIIVAVPAYPINKENVAEMVNFLAAINRNLPDSGTLVFIQRNQEPVWESAQNAARFSLTAYAASIHLERPEIKIRVIRMAHDSAATAVVILNECGEKHPFESVFYSGNERFKLEYKLTDDSANRPSEVNFDSSDVILSTGGAKGITARCTFELAKKYRNKTALAGSSPIGREIEEILEMYKKENLEVRYYTCDITDRDSLSKVISTISEELGPISGVVHGAGRNVPRRAETVSAQEALEEISPKILGGINLCEALKDNDIKCFIALTSVIGVTGMMGNSWYAFANESLDLYLRQTGFKTRTIAYSVWDEIGMGARMGSTRFLSGLGISAIKPSAGVEQFLKWIEYEAGDQQIVVTSRMGNLDTWRLHKGNVPDANRFISEIRTWEPGRNITVRANLSCATDLYLEDHNYNGTLLFPTVFGIEAMAQAACLVAGVTNPTGIVFENVMLAKPIVVPVDGETVIEISAEILPQSNTTTKKIKSRICVDYTDFKEAHFSSEISFSADLVDSTMPVVSEKPLMISPESDLYSWLLFQGRRFRKIESIHTLNSSEVRFFTGSAQNEQEVFAQGTSNTTILGSACLRDVLLQSVQLYLTKKVYLPVAIKRWTIYNAGSRPETGFVHSKLGELRSDSAICDVDFYVDSKLSERIEGYEVKAVGSTPDYPVPETIANLQSFCENAFRKEFDKYSRFNKQKLFYVLYKHSEEFNKLKADARLSLEQKAFDILKAGLEKNGIRPGDEIARAGNGRPVIKNSDMDISISHSGSHLMITAGNYQQGCDIEYIVDRSESEWNDLLDNKFSGTLEQLTKIDGDLNVSATRIWCLREALIKSSGTIPLVITIEKATDKGIILKVNHGEDEQKTVLTFPVNIFPGRTLMVALVIDYCDVQIEDDQQERNSSPSLFDSSEKCFRHNFTATFKDCRGFYGKTHFTVIPDWMGSLRELVLEPICDNLLKDLGTGKYGMVTNASQINIFNEAESLAGITGKLRITDKSDFNNSYIDLSFEFLRNGSGGNQVKLAECSLSTTWVTIEGRGIVKRSPLPGYFLEFLQEHQCKLNGRDQVVLNSAFPRVSQLGKPVYEEKNQIRHNLLLHECDFQTGMTSGNSIGNLYYSNYYHWQAGILEQYLFGMIPDLMKGNGANGEFITIESNVQHIQEAMPFETIHVKMFVDKVFESGLKLYFTYYSVSGNESRKLAYGTKTIVFCTRATGNDLPVPCAIPENVLSHIMDMVKA